MKLSAIQKKLYRLASKQPLIFIYKPTNSSVYLVDSPNPKDRAWGFGKACYQPMIDNGYLEEYTYRSETSYLIALRVDKE